MRPTVLLPQRISGISGGRGGGGDGAPLGGPLMPTAQLFVWLLIGGLTMFFAALCSAAIVRIGIDGRTFLLPPIIWVNTGILVLSSVLLGWAQWRVLKGREVEPKGLRALGAATALGVLFMGGQAVAWYQLAQQGVFLSSSPAAGFFYVLTAAHGVHVVGGLIALAVLWSVRRRGMTFRRRLGPVATYWHFLTFVWLALVIVLQTR